ncbi:MAG: NAD(P)-dependent oxidoreductase [Alphaproteobacteria bacterium]
MSTEMLKFVSRDRAMPDKREAGERRADFDEIFGEFDAERAAAQAARCSQCGIPFCQTHCPLHNNIPDWLMLASSGRLEEAYEIASATNNMPEICGRICPQDRLCEGACVIEKSGHGTVTIGAIEKYITETAWERGWVKVPRPARELGQSIGIIGAGPAGLAAAEELRKRGYQVEIYDRHDRAGGLLVYGIPNFKLEKHVVARRVHRLAEAGVRFHVGAEIGAALAFEDLRARHDAVLIATGVYEATELAVPGVGLGNVVQALDYLIAANRKGLGDRVPAFESGALDARGKRVVVVGGGDTAMDCVRTAVRQGARAVQCLYRRDRKNMPGSEREVRHAEEEGVEFVWLSQPEAVLGDNVACGVRAMRTHLGVPGQSGRQSPMAIEGSHFQVDADLVIKALGFAPEDLRGAFGCPELAVTRRGTLGVDPKSLMTNLDGVFAAGDIVRGASLVVWAIRDGRDAAEGIHRFLSAKATASPARDSARQVA